MTAIAIPTTKRVSFFLDWDATEDAKKNRKPGLLKNIRSRLQQSSALGEQLFGEYRDAACDLDLCCYAFDAAGKCVDAILPGIGRDVNENQSIYHSGDEETGKAAAIDEELSIELSKLAPSIVHLIIYVRIDNAFDPGDSARARMRMTNMTDNQNYFTKEIPFEETDETGQVFCRLSKVNDEWQYSFIGDYTFDHPDDNEDAYFADYLA